MIAAETGRPITIYGDGKQVRDVLHVDDLIAAYEAAIGHPEAAVGQAFNIGGGPANALSLRALLALLEQAKRTPLPVSWAGWRIGDQRVFVSDIRKAKTALGWAPAVPVGEGIARLRTWVHDNARLFEA